MYAQSVKLYISVFTNALIAAVLEIPAKKLKLVLPHSAVNRIGLTIDKSNYKCMHNSNILTSIYIHVLHCFQNIDIRTAPTLHRAFAYLNFPERYIQHKDTC